MMILMKVMLNRIGVLTMMLMTRTIMIIIVKTESHHEDRTYYHIEVYLRQVLSYYSCFRNLGQEDQNY